MVATITSTYVFGSAPSSQVSCAVMNPVGLLDVFIHGADIELASGGDGLTFTCTVPYTSPATNETPFRFYWLPAKVEYVFPPTGTVTQSPPPPTPTPPPPAPPPPSERDSAQPGLFTPGLADPGDNL